jgi:hypothetical protein
MASIGAKGTNLCPLTYLDAYPHLKVYPHHTTERSIRLFIADEKSLDFATQCMVAAEFLEKFERELQALRRESSQYFHLHFPHRFRGKALTVVVPPALARMTGVLGMTLKIFIPAPPYPPDAI